MLESTITTINAATRSIPTSRIILQIICVEFVRQVILVQAVVVERNLYAYYRLPTNIVRTSNTSQSYYVLQCPFRSMFSIPKPQDMGVCAIVGRYRESRTRKKSMKPSEAHLLESAPVQLFAKVEYAEPIKTKKKLMKIVKFKSVKPLKPKPITRPIKMMTASMREMMMIEKPKPRLHKSMSNQKKDISHLKPIKYLDINSSEELEIEKNYTSTSQEITKDHDNQSNERRDHVSDEIDFDDNFSDELQMDATGYSPLRFLAVNDAINKLKLHVPPDHGESYKNSEKFFAELNDYKRGFHTTNYHNMYHRDELYNDHIIYDDLHQAGNYDQKEKVQEKY